MPKFEKSADRTEKLTPKATPPASKGTGRKQTRNDNGSSNGELEAKLWTAADKLRGHMDAGEYKHVVLGLIFLKYISDVFEERHEQSRLWTSDADNEEWYVAEPAVRYTVMEDRARWRR